MKHNAMRAMVILCVLSSPMGCQLIKRLTNRGQDAGAATAAPATPVTPAIVDADASVVAVPNPTVAPMPTTDVDAAAPTMPVADAGAVAVGGDTGAADAGAVAMPTPPAVDAGAAPQPTIAAPAEPAEPGARRNRGPRNYCKDHPGRVNPATGEVCPMRGY